MEVRDRQQPATRASTQAWAVPRLALGAVPVAARIVGDPHVPAPDTARRARRAPPYGSARGTHHAPLRETGCPRSRRDTLARSGRRCPPPRAAAGSCHPGSGRWRSSEVEQLEWGSSPARIVCEGNPGVARRRGDLPMSQQVLDHPDVDALLEQVGGEAAPSAGCGRSPTCRARRPRPPRGRHAAPSAP